MWKRLDESIALSDKLASLGWVSMGVWTYVLAQTDTMGRFHRDSRIIKAKCMTMRYDLRPETVEEALLELEKSGLLHCYAVEGKTYLVLHDYQEFNPPGALGRVSPKYPAPPPGLCRCIDSERRQSGVLTPDVTSCLVSSTSTSEGVEGEDPPAPNSPEAMILGILERKNCPSNPQTIRRYARGWITDKGFQYVEQVTMDPWCKGKDIIAIHDRFFREPKGPAKMPKRKVHNPGCEKCKGTGRRFNPATKSDMDCGCVREIAV